MCSHLSLAPTNEYNVYSRRTTLLLQMFVFPLVLMCHIDISLGLLLRRHPTLSMIILIIMMIYTSHIYTLLFLRIHHKSASHPSNLSLVFLLSSYFHRLYGMCTATHLRFSPVSVYSFHGNVSDANFLWLDFEVVPKLHLYLFFSWCQLIYFSAGYSHRVQMAPGIRLMGRMHTSSRFKK